MDAAAEQAGATIYVTFLVVLAGVIVVGLAVVLILSVGDAIGRARRRRRYRRRPPAGIVIPGPGRGRRGGRRRTGRP